MPDEEGNFELEEAGPLPETEQPNSQDAGIDLTVAPAEPEPEDVSGSNDFVDSVKENLTDTRQQIQGMLDEHRIKSRKRKPGRPKIKAGIAGIYSRTKIDPAHISEYIRLRALDLVDRLGGPERVLPEQDALIGAAMAALELVMRTQAEARTNPAILADPRTLGAISTTLRSFQQSLKSLGLAVKQGKEKTDPRREVVSQLRETLRRQRGKK